MLTKKTKSGMYLCIWKGYTGIGKTRAMAMSAVLSMAGM